jgi:hypothetical protein
MARAQVQPIPIFGVKTPVTFINGTIPVGDHSSTYVVDVSAYSTATITLKRNVGASCGNSQLLVQYLASNAAGGPYTATTGTGGSVALQAGRDYLTYNVSMVGPYAKFSFARGVGDPCEVSFLATFSSLPLAADISGPLPPSTLVGNAQVPNPVIIGGFDKSTHPVIIAAAPLATSWPAANAGVPIGAIVVAGVDPTGALQPIRVDATGDLAISASASTTTASTFAASEKLMLTASAVSLFTADAATRWVLVTNMGPNPIEIGPASVTYGTGSPVPANGGERSIDCVSPCVLYGITVTGNQVAGLGTRVMVGSHP